MAGQIILPEDEIVIPTLDEQIQLGAVDGDYFAHNWFPRTMRQGSAPFHPKMWKKLDSTSRLVSFQIFRGAAKTTLCRVYIAKRIAYGLAHTIMIIGKSEGHALRSARWLKRHIQYNRYYTETFQLRKGDKWADDEFEIWHGTDEYPVTLLAVGIEGAVRGINVDDYRPDLIMLDDVVADENAATEEQREKLADLIDGAVKESLAPRSENPDAKLVMLNTPINRDDASCRTEHDPEWDFMRVSCWTPETEDLEIDQRESSWPIRFPSKELRESKRNAIKRNKNSVFSREKECKVIDSESTTLVSTWLQSYDLEPDMEEQGMSTVMIIDPVPPPSPRQIQMGLKDKDYECLMVIGRCQNKFYCLEYEAKKGHYPNWTVMQFFRLGRKWGPRIVLIESVNYQRTLKWLLDEAMSRQGVYYHVEAVDDKRSKDVVIADGLSGPGSNHVVFAKPGMGMLRNQWNDYPNVNHEDVLECLARGVEELQKPQYGFAGGGDYKEEERDIPTLEHYRAAP